MHKFILLLASLGGLALAGNSTAQHAQLSHFDCGSQQGHAKEDLMKAIKEHHGAQTAKGGSAAARAARAALLARDGNIAIDTYLHVVTTNANAGQYSNWQKMTTDQIATMNKAYNPHGISFNLKGSELTKNDAWASAKSDSSDIKAMKKALRKGSYAALNIYFHSDLGGGILGTCTMPSGIGGTNDYSTDGCSVNAGTMPGGSQLGFNQGMTAVHETGHWMGLLHTFEGNSCSGDGDLIDDTRAEAESTSGCPTSPAKNSCPGLSGTDPIHNYMDYSIDSCYEDFTPMQQQRMHNLWGQFRQGK
ncbi:hypothetical protein HDK77DRAFT_426290 [Phyllosticta capitalensis]|uniref:Peptidase M43 pregnancy-associated plasma-A domain-containing protein n=1 Tax=Phyllosticta capitalensis TaxID=121624 RepID=A0ABR1Z3X7_9PEZI